MALTGHFDADFSSFYAACANAQVSIKGFQGDIDVVNRSMSRMVDEFSGVKIVAQATMMAQAVDDIGGAAKLTSAELQRVGDVAAQAIEKMKAMGMEVPANIQAIADAAKSAGSGLEAFFKDFNIKEAISDPLAFAGSAVSALAESMGPAAVAAAGYAAGIVAVEVALFKLTEQAAQVGAHLNDVGEVTGIAVPRLSQLSLAAQVAGTDLGTLNNAVFQMNKQMELSPSKFNDGLERLNINAVQFRAMAPEDKLTVLSSALNATGDAAERTAAGSEIMGRQFRDIEPALLKLNVALEKTADIRPWTDEEAKQAEAFVMEIDNIKVHAEAMATAFGRSLIGPIEDFVGVIVTAKQKIDDLTPSWVVGPIDGFRMGWSNVTTVLGYGATAFDTLRGAAVPIPPVLDDIAKKLDALKKAQAEAFDKANRPDLYLAAMNAELQNLKINVPTLTDGMTALKEMEKNTDPETQKLIESHKKLQTAFDNLASTGDGWKGTLDTIDGAVVESIISYRDAGVAMTDLGLIHSDLSKAQLDSIEKERDARAKAAKEAQKNLDEQAKLEAKTKEMTEKLWDEYDANRVKQLGTVTEIAKAENLKQYNDAVAKAIQMGIVDANYWDALEAKWKQRNDAIGVDWAALGKVQADNNAKSVQALQELADNAKKTYEEAAKHAGDWSDAQIKHFQDVATAAQLAADQAAVPWAKFYAQGIAAAKQEDIETQAAQARMQDAIKSTTGVAQAELDKRLTAARAAMAAGLASEKTTQQELATLITESSQAYYNANLNVKADFSQTAQHISDVMSVSFSKSAQAFDAFKTIVVGGSQQMLAGLIAVTDAGTWMEQQRQMKEAQDARNPFYQYLGPTGAPPVTAGLPMQYRDSGGPVTAGTSYLIGGGNAPEIFTPGADGFVTPNATNGGGGVRVSNVFNIVDTESNITRRVSDSITRSIMAAQKL